MTEVKNGPRGRVDRVVVPIVSQDGLGSLGRVGELADVRDQFAPAAKRALKAGVCDAERFSVQTFVHAAPARIGSLSLAGLGSFEKLTPAVLRSVAAQAARRARRERCTSVGIPLDCAALTQAGESWGTAAVVEALADGWRHGNYRGGAYKSDGRTQKRNREVSLTMYTGGVSARGCAAAAKRGAAIGDAVSFAREIGDAPANKMTPAALARRARELARSSRVTVKIAGEADIRRLKMGALLAVAQGSALPPRLIECRYRPRTRASRRIVLVGKAITFDSGGLSLKPARGMEEMKFDLCGGAAVLGAMRAIAKLEPRIEVVALVPACENMVSGNSVRPGDIVTSASGKTIEVLNTDAEGRLILADALHYAKRFKPDWVVDIATLTGAVVVALGNLVSGLIANDDALAERVAAAGEASGDRVWRLPLFDEAIEATRGQYADIRNSCGRPAGAITAGAFLSHFAGEVPWCHLDIAGTGWTDRESPGAGPGASGVGVRLLTRLVEDLARG